MYMSSDYVRERIFDVGFEKGRDFVHQIPLLYQ